MCFPQGLALNTVQASASELEVEGKIMFGLITAVIELGAKSANVRVQK